MARAGRRSVSLRAWPRPRARTDPRIPPTAPNRCAGRATTDFTGPYQAWARGRAPRRAAPSKHALSGADPLLPSDDSPTKSTGRGGAAFGRVAPRVHSDPGGGAPPVALYPARPGHCVTACTEPPATKASIVPLLSSLL
jgi:hypothetical protein